MIPPVKVVADDVDSETDTGSRTPMTAEQKAELAELCEKLGEPMDDSLTEMEAQKRIAMLQEMDDA